MSSFCLKGWLAQIDNRSSNILTTDLPLSVKVGPEGSLIKFNRACGSAYSITALPLLALLAVGTRWQTSFASSEHSGVFDNIESQIKSLVSTPGESKIKGTYSSRHLLDSYSAGVQHVQGIAWLTDGRFALSHNSRADRRGLFIVQSSDSDSVIVPIGGGGDHPGGMQAGAELLQSQ